MVNTNGINEGDLDAPLTLERKEILKDTFFNCFHLKSQMF